MNNKAKHINLEYLENMTGGSPEIVKEMISIFISQVPEIVTEMHDLYRKKEWKALGMLAHKAKSSVSIMGMNQLAEDLKELEMLTKELKEIERYHIFIDKFEKECTAAISELKEIATRL
jgi:HPt (histidine-containing phosphotransfer) domain-containing protein